VGQRAVPAHAQRVALPGEKELSQDDLVAATDRGILIVGDGSFSIDQQRYNAQFGGQVFYEIKGGKVVGQLKDVAYQIRTPDFWNSLDMIGGKRSYQLGGSFFDGKGQPGPGERGEPRQPAGPLPQRQRDQHREEGLMRATDASRGAQPPRPPRRPRGARPAGVELDAAAADTVLTRDEAQQIVEKAIKMSKADGVEVQVSSGYTGQRALRRQPDEHLGRDQRRAARRAVVVRPQARRRHHQRPERRVDPPRRRAERAHRPASPPTTRGDARAAAAAVRAGGVVVRAHGGAHPGRPRRAALPPST
jgi:hypothetical protein